MNGIITTKTWSELCHHLSIPLGIREAIEAKIISDIPLPTPRWVISSPSHIKSVVPAVSEITIRKTLVKVFSPIGLALPARKELELKRKT
jgi:hypothetical protein